MPGIRLRHPELRNRILKVSIPWRPLKNPFLCPECGEAELFKTYHLHLDDDGTVIVSEKVHERLKEVNLAGLEMVNVVADPPTINLNLGGMPPARFKVVEKQIGGKNG